MSQPPATAVQTWEADINRAVSNAILNGVPRATIYADLVSRSNLFVPPPGIVSNAGLQMAARLIRGFESFRAAPYQDSAGFWTIGYGTIRINGQPVTAATPPITEVEAIQLMMVEMTPDYALVCVNTPATTTDNQHAALTSFAYNEGINALLGSTLLAKVKAGDIPGAAIQFAAWNKIHDPVTRQLVDCPGLTNRRRAEAAVFLGAPPA